MSFMYAPGICPINLKGNMHGELDACLQQLLSQPVRSEVRSVIIWTNQKNLFELSASF